MKDNSCLAWTPPMQSRRKATEGVGSHQTLTPPFCFAQHLPCRGGKKKSAGTYLGAPVGEQSRPCVVTEGFNTREKIKVKSEEKRWFCIAKHKKVLMRLNLI